MTLPLDITSPTNTRVKTLVRLRRRRHRDDEGVTLVEGFEELSIAVSAGVEPLSVFVCPDLVSPGEWALLEAPSLAGVEVVRVARVVFEKLAYRESPDGWLGVLPSVATTLDDLRTDATSLVLVCEGVEKPGNLGAMLRTADAAGVTAVIAMDPVTDWANPNVVRGSKGAVYTVPVVAAARDEVLAWLEARAIALVATTPDATADYADVDLTGAVAIAVGSEKYGLSEQTLRAATHRVLIPMHGRVDSLNVSVSAAVLLYEAVRQRRTLR